MFWPCEIRLRHMLQIAAVGSDALVSKKAHTKAKNFWNNTQRQQCPYTCGALRCDEVGVLPLSWPLEGILPHWRCASSSSSVLTGTHVKSVTSSSPPSSSAKLAV
ncbi:hypothetical protein AB205_0117560, partial [Aquarana catesbeiana]